MRDGRRFQDLVDVTHRLRSPGGCPWDREQTFRSLRQYVLEEAYEVVDALEAEAPDKLADECGDLLFQVVFLSEIAEERGQFGIDDVVRRIHDKLVRRHPHVFGDVKVDDAAHVVRNWEAIKDTERAGGDAAASALDGVPHALPALLRAKKLGGRAARAGFDWRRKEDVADKIAEELAEVREAMKSGDRAAAEAELGDLLFAVAQLARVLEIDPEDAGRQAGRKFEGRYRHMEASRAAGGRRPSDASDDELDRLWHASKGAPSTS
jgi:MazG family protein